VTKRYQPVNARLTMHYRIGVRSADKAWRGEARPGEAGQAWQGKAGPGMARLGEAGQAYGLPGLARTSGVGAS